MDIRKFQYLFLKFIHRVLENESFCSAMVPFVSIIKRKRNLRVVSQSIKRTHRKFELTIVQNTYHMVFKLFDFTYT